MQLKSMKTYIRTVYHNLSEYKKSSAKIHEKNLSIL